MFLAFSSCYLAVKALVETDEVELSLIDGIPPEGRQILDEFVGMAISEAWTCANSRGYKDMVCFGFDSLHPDLVILCEGSSLKVFTTRPN